MISNLKTKCSQNVVLVAVFILICISLLIVFHSMSREIGEEKTSNVCILANKSSSLEWLGAKELRRYLYLLSGRYNDLIDIAQEEVDEEVLSRYAHVLLIINKNDFESTFQNDFDFDPDDLKLILELESEQHVVKEYTSMLTRRGIRWTLCIGGSGIGSLYSAYSFVELLGVRFYIHRDVIPDNSQQDFEIPFMNEVKTPKFKVRGILPFHAYPEGPDWWGTNEYKLYLSQMTKMKMNFIGLHTYPLVEPTVWVGVDSDFDKRNGKVSTSYPTSWASTLRGTWGYPAKPTTNYSFGSSLLFPYDCYSGESNVNSVFQQACPYPTSTSLSNDVFARATALLQNAFTYANDLNIKTCVGTEIALTKPNSSISTESYYQGIFNRVTKSYPIDYYWLWTPEEWEWGRLTTSNPIFSDAVQDLLTAHRIKEKLKVPFQLVSSGWELGPVDARAILDELLPNDYIISSIDLNVGLDPVDVAYRNITKHSKWVIPWMEDDPGFTVVQLWVNRTLEHSISALQYGAEGLIALHWRTVSISPQLSAMAMFQWNSSLISNDYWDQWAQTEFGSNVGTKISHIFQSIDSFNLPKPVTWFEGPGGMVPNGNDWSETLKNYTFIDNLERLRGSVHEQYMSNFDYWMDSFYFMREVANITHLWYEFNEQMNQVVQVTDVKDRNRMVSANLKPIYDSMGQAWTTMMTYLQQTIYSFGEMGTLMNMEQHNMPFVITMSAAKLALVQSKCTEYYTYIGCYADQPQRDLNGKWRSDLGITPFECAAFCVGYSYFGLQYGYVDFYGNRSYCFCGESYGKYGSVNNSQCNMPCSGDPNSICGGNFTNSVYTNICGKKVVPQQLSKEYQSTNARLIVPTVRTSLNKDEVFFIKALILASSKFLNSTKVTFYYRTIRTNQAEFKESPMRLIADERQVYYLELSSSETMDDFEYYIEASLSPDDDNNLRFPEPNQRILYQTVIVVT